MEKTKKRISKGLAKRLREVKQKNLERLKFLKLKKNKEQSEWQELHCLQRKYTNRGRRNNLRDIEGTEKIPKISKQIRTTNLNFDKKLRKLLSLGATLTGEAQEYLERWFKELNSEVSNSKA